MKTILILYPYRENYINILSCLSSNNFYVLLIDESKRESFNNLPQNVELASIKNYVNNCREKAEELLRERTFDAIVPLDEFDVLLAAELREKFQINGQKVNEAIIFRNKNKMTRKVKDLGFTVPESKIVANDSELHDFLETHHDIILKPLSGAGSVNTFRIQSNKDVGQYGHNFFEQAELAMVQEYIDSDIYHIDGFLSNGEIIYCEPSKYLYNPLLIKQGFSAAAVSLDKCSQDYSKLVEYANSLIKKLYPGGTFLFHLEVFYDSKNIIFLEIACRVGGARIRQNLEYKFAYNPIKLLIDSISGEPLPKLPEQYPNTAWLLTAKRKGIITELPLVSEDIKKQYSIFDYIEYAKVGQNLNSAFHSADAVIGLSLSGPSFAETEKKLLAVEEWLLDCTRYHQ